MTLKVILQVTGKLDQNKLSGTNSRTLGRTNTNFRMHVADEPCVYEEQKV